MRSSETHSYNKYIEVASKLDLIGKMLESLDDITEDILPNDEYEPILDAQDGLHNISKSMRARAKTFITED